MNRFFAGLFFALSAWLARAGDPAPELAPFVTREDAPEWSANFAAALDEAEARGRLVLLNFTAPNDCARCQRLREQILTQKPFIEYARERLVLVEVSFAQGSAPDERREKLKERFGVKEFPTVILVDIAGRELGRTGYMQGGAKTFVRELKRFSANAAAPTAPERP